MIRSGFIALTLIVFFVCSCSPKQAQPPSSDKAPALVPPKVISIASLPDSLQPKTISLDKMPKPLTVAVPVKERGFYRSRYSNGDTVKVMLKPPVKKMLAVLMDEKGQPVKDAAGSPFIMGTGGNANFTNFSSDDGLALNGLYCSMMDKAGNLWFGTQGGGASRYDGKVFTTYTTIQGLPDNTITCLLQDKAGNIWFGTQSGGASKYDGKSFTSLTTVQGLPDDDVQALCEDKEGNLWIGTLSGLSKYDGKAFTNFSTKDGLPNNAVHCIAQDRGGNIWLGTNGGASKYDGKSFTNYTAARGLAGNLVNCMAEAKDGALWFGTNSGASKYDGKAFTSFGISQGLINGLIRAITEDKAGNLWFGTFGGLSRYDGRTFRSYTTGQGLAANHIRSITEDKAGNLWFGTFEAGVSKYAGNSFTSFTAADGLPANVVFYVNQDSSGSYWFCTTDGLSRYDGRSFTNFTISQGLARNYVQCMAEDKAGNLWFGSAGGGAIKYDGRSFTTFSTEQGLPDNSVLQILEDKAGYLWFGTSGGLSRFDGKSFTNYTSAQGLIANSITDLCHDKEGNLWVATNGGVSRFDGKAFTNFSTAQGLPIDLANSVTEDSYGNLWIGTQGGVSRLSAKQMDKQKPPYPPSNGASEVKIDNFTTAQGLADDQVYDIVQDKKGNIFIGTNLGFTMIPAEIISLPFSEVRKRVEYYNRPSGYPIRDVNSNAMYCDSQGIIWSGTGSGLVRFDYSSLQKAEAAPVFAIQKIKVNGENICWFDLQSGGKPNNAGDSAKSMFQESMAYGKMISPTDRDSVIKRFRGIRFDSISSFYLLPQGLELPYEKNQITIDFNAVETSKPQQVEYQYMLQGYEKQWSPVTKTTSATFGNMYEGRYSFMVKARKSNGDWSVPVAYSFKVLPPWYRTWWSYLFYGLCLIASIILIDRIRRRVVEERLLARARETELAQAKEIEKAYTELKTTQAQLIQSEKMASLGELTAGIAHEIQNPLNFVNNFSEVNKELAIELQQELKSGKIDEAIAISNDIINNEEKINHHGKRADAIVKGMLQHTRSSTNVKEPTDINKLADEYLRLAYHGLRAKDNSFNATMKTDFDESVGNIHIVPQDMGRVLLNLYTNAFYAVSEKKKTAAEGYEPAISVSTKKSDNKITITVSDNGNGIPQKALDKIFQPFFTTKPTGQGTGLGLSLSYDIVKAHGGEIKVGTIDGKGSEFTVELPLRQSFDNRSAVHPY